MEDKSFFADIVYNRSKRTKFFVFLILAVFLVGGSGVSLIYFGGTSKFFGWFFVAVTICLFFLIPYTLKNNPVHENPIITVCKKSVIVNGKEYSFDKISSVKVNIGLTADLNSEKKYEEILDEAINNYNREDIYRGTVDFNIKEGSNIKVEYTTVVDALGVIQELVNRNYNKYSLTFSLKKLCKNANFKIEKIIQEEEKLSSLTEKQRRKQLI